MAEDDRLEPGDAIYTAFIPPEWVEHYIRAMDTPLQWLAQEVQKAEESQPLEDMVPAQYHDFRDVFSKEAFDELPLQKAWDHAIDLTPGTELPCSWTFPCPLQNRRSLMTSSGRTLQTATSIHTSPPWEPLCSSSKRRMVHLTSYRTFRS